MDNNKDALQELLAGQQVIRAQLSAGAGHKTELSTRLIVGAFCYFAALTIVCIALWALVGDWPQEIIEVLVWPFIAGSSACICGCYYKEKKK